MQYRERYCSVTNDNRANGLRCMHAQQQPLVTASQCASPRDSRTALRAALCDKLAFNTLRARLKRKRVRVISIWRNYTNDERQPAIDKSAWNVQAGRCNDNCRRFIGYGHSRNRVSAEKKATSMRINLRDRRNLMGTNAGLKTVRSCQMSNSRCSFPSVQ